MRAAIEAINLGIAFMPQAISKKEDDLQPSPISGPLGLSGHELDGDSLVRLVYVDESGSGNESWLVVASVVIHADTQWKPVEIFMSQLVDKYVLAEDRLGFYFHAKDLFHGTGKIFGKRDKYSVPHRCEALKGLLSIPGKFQLPVIFGFIPRTELLSEDQALAYSLCVTGVERYMREWAGATEIAKMIAEDNQQTKEAVRRMHGVLRSKHPALAEYQRGVADQFQYETGFFPITKVVDAVSFESKREALFLQLADACALIIRYYIEGRTDIDQFIHAFTPTDPHRIGDLEKIRSSRGGKLDIRCWD
jgi:hypothetical protein